MRRRRALWVLLLVVLLVAAPLVDATARRKSRRRAIPGQTPPQVVQQELAQEEEVEQETAEVAADAEMVDGLQQHVAKRGLVTRKPTAASILMEHDKPGTDQGTRNFAGDTLAYLTPWNRSTGCLSW